MGPKDGVFVPMLHGFALPHLRLCLAWWEKFSCYIPVSFRKTLLIFYLLHNYYNFLKYKTCFINKNILEIKTKFIP